MPLIHILSSTKDLRIVSSGNDYPTKRPISVVQASCYPDVNGQNSLVYVKIFELEAGNPSHCPAGFDCPLKVGG